MSITHSRYLVTTHVSLRSSLSTLQNRDQPFTEGGLSNLLNQSGFSCHFLSSIIKATDRDSSHKDTPASDSPSNGSLHSFAIPPNKTPPFLVQMAVRQEISPSHQFRTSQLYPLKNLFDDTGIRNLLPHKRLRHIWNARDPDSLGSDPEGRGSVLTDMEPLNSLAKILLKAILQWNLSGTGYTPNSGLQRFEHIEYRYRVFDKATESWLWRFWRTNSMSSCREPSPDLVERFCPETLWNTRQNLPLGESSFNFTFSTSQALFQLSGMTLKA